MTRTLYDPLTYENLMLGVVSHFEQQPVLGLADIRTQDVQGPGIYALFYAGGFAPYQPISRGTVPIYVGKAVPPGSRKGLGMPDLTKPKLRERLVEHANSVSNASNLSLMDFSARALPMEPVWITLAERFLVAHYQPVWNTCLDGFGNHDPGGGRRGGERSWWDTLHPGRDWASQLSEVKTPEAATALVAEFFARTDDAH